MTDQVVFLSYVVSVDDMKMDDEKLKVILHRPTPKSLTEVRSFHGLVSFYQRFIKIFNTIIALMLNVLKKKEFQWTSEAEKSF